LYRLLFRLDAETAHGLGSSALRLLGRSPRRFVPDPVLRVHALGLTFDTPLGVGAGLDKTAVAFDGLRALGFGFVEIGTITAVPQPGNPRPRVWRLPAERALVNAMGFPNPGAAAVVERLAGHRGIVGVNLGKSKVTPLEEAADDYRRSAELLAPHADFIVLNVSSPNTPGLRELQAVESLGPLVDAVGSSRPVLIKLAPDLADADLDAIADFARGRVAGLVATNTTIARPVATEHPGGLSGAPLKARSLAVLRRLRARVGDELVLVSIGGVESAADVLERVRAGATLVQAYTGFIYGGPLWPRRVNAELASLVRAAGAASIQELVGTG
jgi:dihydroorotate dehydrogenase